MPRVTRSALLRWVAVVLSVSVLAACSDDSGDGTDTAEETEAPAAADADTYAERVCGALSDWMTSIEEGNATLQGSLENEVDLEQVKQRLLEFLDDTIANTDDMIARVEDAGAPDVDNGEELHQRLLDLLGQAKTAFEDARDTVEGLDASNAQELGTGLQELGISLQTAFADVQNPLENADSEELDRAFEDNEACTSLEDMAA